MDIVKSTEMVAQRRLARGDSTSQQNDLLRHAIPPFKFDPAYCDQKSANPVYEWNLCHEEGRRPLHSGPACKEILQQFPRRPPRSRLLNLRQFEACESKPQQNSPVLQPAEEKWQGRCIGYEGDPKVQNRVAQPS